MSESLKRRVVWFRNWQLSYTWTNQLKKTRWSVRSVRITSGAFNGTIGKKRKEVRVPSFAQQAVRCEPQLALPLVTVPGNVKEDKSGKYGLECT